HSMDPDSLILYKFTMPASLVCEPFIMVLITGSVYTTVILSLDRCLAVLRPLHWASILTRRRMKLALLLVFIFAVVVDSPVYFQAELRVAYFPKFNDSFLSGRPTEYYFSWFHQEVYLRHIMPVVQIIVPLVLIVTSNAAIVAKLFQHKRKSSALQGKPRGVDFSKLTAQVIAISVITLTSRVLAAANFYIVTEEEIFYIKYCSRACAWTGAFNIFFIKINSSVNFVFYCFFGGKFRKVFKTTFGCFLCQ
ncbi:hypothetical protein EGW08_003177, partial [Elysia chlorotica]